MKENSEQKKRESFVISANFLFQEFPILYKSFWQDYQKFLYAEVRFPQSLSMDSATENASGLLSLGSIHTDVNAAGGFVSSSDCNNLTNSVFRHSAHGVLTPIFQYQ
jgi:hypothetical protein